MRRWLCAIFGGGHAWSSPQVVEGRVRLRCLFDCGALTSGIETLGQEQQRLRQQIIPFLNLQVTREKRRRVA